MHAEALGELMLGQSQSLSNTLHLGAGHLLSLVKRYKGRQGGALRAAPANPRALPG
jgi:hypothetical protein